MSEFPLGYERIPPATWVYLSSLLMIGLYFKFNRVWSVRNVDLLLLIMLAPGLLMVYVAEEQIQRDKLENRTPEVTAAPVARDREFGDESDVDDDSPSAPTGETNGAKDSTTENQDAPPADTSASPGELETDESAADAGANGDEAAGSIAAGDPRPSELAEKIAVRPTLVRTPAERLARTGYMILFVVCALLLVRMFMDTSMVRRPLLEPNLTSAGLTFIGCSLLVFLIANVVTSKPSEVELEGLQSARQLVQGEVQSDREEQFRQHGPGYPLLHFLPVLPTVVEEFNGEAADEPSEQDVDAASAPPQRSDVIVAKMMAVIGQLLIVVGLAVIGVKHFHNFRMGVGIATLYLMLPYTALMTGRVSHSLPAALLVWAVASYRRPLIAGGCIGLAMGTVYYPLFLLPLWISFYWRRGLMRFLTGFMSSVVVMGIVLAFASTSFADYVDNLRAMFGVWQPRTEGLGGIWSLGWDSIYRLPILAGFVALSVTFAFWPAQKNLGTLISCSCAVMVAVQFWHGYGGGLYMAWYLPLLLLTIFRPNLEDRVALSVLRESWRPGRRRSLQHSKAA